MLHLVQQIQEAADTDLDTSIHSLAQHRAMDGCLVHPFDPCWLEQSPEQSQKAGTKAAKAARAAARLSSPASPNTSGGQSSMDWSTATRREASDGQPGPAVSSAAVEPSRKRPREREESYEASHAPTPDLDEATLRKASALPASPSATDKGKQPAPGSPERKRRRRGNWPPVPQLELVLQVCCLACCPGARRMVPGFRCQGNHFCSCARPAVTIRAFLAPSKLLLQRPSLLLDSLQALPLHCHL